MIDPGPRSFWQGKIVLVTGGAGFIGSHVVDLLIGLGASVTVPVRPSCIDTPRNLSHLENNIRLLRVNLEDDPALARVLEGVDIVLYLAANTGTSVFHASSRHGSLAYENIKPFLSVLEASRLAGVARFLVCSSACVYPAHAQTPICEEEGFVGMPEPSNEGYAMAKRFQEYIGTQYAREHGMHVTIARLFNAYGPRDYFDPFSSHVIPALICKTLDATDTLELWGTGNALRGFLYVEDVARGLLKVAERAPVAQPINIGPKDVISIRDLGHLLARLCGKEQLRLVFDTSKPEGQPRRSADMTRAERLLGFYPSVSLEEGLQHTISWFQRPKLPTAVASQICPD